MKFPKLKHPWLCQHLLYAPVYLAFGSLFVPGILQANGIKTPGWAFAIGFIGLMGLALWYLFHNFILLFGSDLVFSEIHTWQRDRLEFTSRINGADGQTALRRICRRCALWGRRWEEGETGRFIIYYKHAYSWTVYHSIIEKRIVLCQTDHLSPEQYHLLLGQARSILSRLPDGVVRFRTKQEKKAPRAYISMIVILADTVDDAVKTKARELPLNTDDACILPCVVECPMGHYYMNGGKSAYQVGMMGRPAQNYARGMARRLVFAVGLPKKNPDKRPPFADAELLEKSLWDYIRAMKADVKELKSGEEKERVKMLRRLNNGEVRVGEYAIYCKLQDRIAVWAYLPDEDDEKRVSLQPGDTWYYQKDVFRHSIMFRGEINRRKMKPDQIKDVDRRIRAWLTANGYCIEEES